MKQSLCLLEIEPLFAVNRGSIRGHAVFFLVFFLTKKIEQPNEHPLKVAQLLVCHAFATLEKK